jgi:hypothetical protein
MYSPPTGGPAFPTGHAYQGMTLRDYFATAVLQGWMASDVTPNDPPSKIAMEAYSMADEMLKARNKNDHKLHNLPIQSV